ncbi:hypothetical protein Tco_0692449 [Tanacetum coccineum]
MSTQAEPIPMSSVQNTVGKGNEQTLENSNRLASDAALREYCDKHYHQLFPPIAEKVPRHRNSERKRCSQGWEEMKEAYSTGWGVKEDVCPHTQMTPDPNNTGTTKEKRRAATRAPIQGKRNPFPERITTKEHL